VKTEENTRSRVCDLPIAKESHCEIILEDLFSIDALQTLQDQFAQATGVASVITRPDGTPITRPSNFCRLCERIIRHTEKGRKNCFHSDSVIGRHNPDNPIVQQCLSGGLWDAGASITVNGHHIANWLIGQVRNEAQDDTHMRAYAREIGTDEEAFLEAFHEVPAMSLEKFRQVAQVLFTLAQQLSSTAYQNVLQARFIEARIRADAKQRELDDQRNRQQKLECMVKLAGGISHDFNNLLQALMGSIDLILPELPEGSPVRADVANMQHLCQRMASLSRQMQVCSGGLIFTPCPLDLNRLIAGAQSDLKQCVRDGVTFSFDLAPDLPPVKGDESLLRQAIRNLVINASEALAGTPNSVTLRTGTARLEVSDLAQAILCDDLSAGDFVTLDILDTGCGMDHTAMQSLFDPLFTTKPITRGLGLAEVLGIMRAHEGAIFVASQMGQGTTVRLAWPRLPAAHGVSPSAPQTKPAYVPQATEGSTILVVDDEPSVLTIAQRSLALSGYRVLTAADGLEGVNAFQSAPSTIALVLLDLSMPNMDGVQAFREIRRIRPDVPVIIASGYSEQDTLKRFGSDRPSGFLQKPYMRETLLKHVATLVKGACH